MLQIAQGQLQLSREAFDWYQGIYDRDLKPAQEQDQAMRQQMIQSFLTDSALQREFAREQNEYFMQRVRPLGDRVIQDAESYDSAENIARRQGIAGAAVTQAFSNARDQAARDLQRRGLNPNSGAFAKLNERLANAQALSESGARTNAAFTTIDQANAMRANAYGLMQGIPSQAAAYYGLSNNALNSAGGQSLAGMEGMRSNAALGGQGFGLAGQLNSSAGNLYGQYAQLQNQTFDTQMRLLSSMGQAAGMAIGYSSSKDMKEGKRPVEEGKALKGIKRLDIESWNYKGDREKHVGPYAEDFRQEFGVGTGKTIAVQDAIGVTMKAVQDLAEEVEELKAKKGGIRKANGGKVHKGRGPVRGPGGPIDDKVPAMLSDGEYVLPADTVQKLGVKNLDALVKRTHVPAAVQRGLRRKK
jgi:hypothetical protein